MSILLILSLFVIWLSWTPGNGALVDPSFGWVLLLAGFAALVLMARILNRRAMHSMSFDHTDRALRGFNRRMSLARFLIPGWFAAGVFALGWGDVVHWLLGPAGAFWLELPGVLLGLLPPLLAWAGLWWSQFEIDRALREQNMLVRIEHDMPVYAPSTFWPYFRNKLRTQILFTLVPLLLILLLHDAIELAVRWLAQTPQGHRLGLTWPLADSAESALSLVAAGAVFLFSPLILRRVLHTQRLADSPLRHRLEMLCQNAGLRCRDILLWRTQNNLGNAAVMGLIAPLRYVILSDLLLSTLTDEQIEAVFAHELGHVRHKHLAWFLAFFAGASAVLYVLENAAGWALGPHLPQGQWVGISGGVVSAAVLLLGFGALSRRFERQADVFAARLIQRSIDPTHSTPPLPAGPMGSAVFASALQRIAWVNNISVAAPNWTHGSIANRMRYIRRLGRNPAEVALFDRKIKWLRAVLILGLLLGIAATVWSCTRPVQSSITIDLSQNP